MSTILISIIWIIAVLFIHTSVVNKDGGKTRADGSVEPILDGIGTSIILGSLITIIIAFIIASI